MCVCLASSWKMKLAQGDGQYIDTRFSSRPLAWLDPSTNSVLLKLVCYAPFLQQSMKLKFVYFL